MNYKEYYKDPRWQKARLLILERDEFVCQCCYSTDKTLHVHHRVYVSGRKPWEYDEKFLVTLCEDCHSKETSNMQEACETLITSAKINFLSADIDVIAGALLKCNIAPASDVVASVIEYWLSNKKRTKYLVDEYFNQLKKKNTKKGK